MVVGVFFNVVFKVECVVVCFDDEKYNVKWWGLLKVICVLLWIIVFGVMLVGFDFW